MDQIREDRGKRRERRDDYNESSWSPILVQFLGHGTMPGYNVIVTLTCAFSEYSFRLCVNAFHTVVLYSGQVRVDSLS